MRRKQSYHHGDLRTSIVRAGWQLIDKQGIAKLSLREAARLVGVSHNAPYRHFPDRESLLAAHAALRENATRVFESLAQALAPQLPGAAGRDASIAAWALVHGLAQLLLDERIASAALRGRDRADLVRAVLGSIRFAAAKPQSPP